jgi:hypothetical protein
MFDFLRRIPGMLGLKGGARNGAPKRSGSTAGRPEDGPASDADGAPNKPRRAKSPSQRRSGPKPKSGGGRPKRKK